jgi:uncharacterized protein (DUF433 family)
MDWTGCSIVEIVPGKVSGKPILKHSRVTADAVLESYELGETVEEIVESFDLNPDDVRCVLDFAASREPLRRTA